MWKNYKFTLYTKLWDFNLFNDDWVLDLDADFVEVASYEWNKVYIRPEIIMWFTRTSFLKSEKKENGMDD